IRASRFEREGREFDPLQAHQYRVTGDRSQMTETPPSSVLRHLSSVESVGGERGAAAQAELAIDVVEVDFHGSFGDRQLSRDLLVGKAGGDEAHDFPFPRRQRLDPAARALPARRFAAEGSLDEIGGEPAAAGDDLIKTIEE